MTIHETGFPAHLSGPIGRTLLLGFTRTHCCSPLVLCPRTYTCSTRPFHGRLCSRTRTMARDGFAVQLGLRHERPTSVCTEPGDDVSVPGRMSRAPGR